MPRRVVGRGRSAGRSGGANRGGSAGHDGDSAQKKAKVITGFMKNRASANVQVETLESMPRGRPHESPKAGVRKRKWTPRTKMPLTSTPPPSSASPSAASLSPTAMSTVPPQALPPPALPPPALPPPTLPGPALPQPVLPPSSHAPPSQKKIAAITNYGSEDEDEDDDNKDDEDCISFSTSRVDRDFDLEVKVESIDEIGDPIAPFGLPGTPTSPILNAGVVQDAAAAATVEQFHFDWRQIGRDESGGQRRCSFVGDSKGRAVHHYDTPYDAFTAIWDVEFMKEIVFQTNLYAQQHAESLFQQKQQTASSRLQFWKDTTVDELYSFFAICMAMGVVVKSKVASYWCSKGDIFSTPGFSVIMSLRRYQLLNTCLHFVNNNDMITENLNGNQAKLFKIKSVVDHLNLRFPRLYTLGRNLSLDESLTMWKGSLSFNQRIRTKAAKRGIKTYEVCESDTGYLWRFEMHTGPAQEKNEHPVSGPIPALVLRLLNGLENKGHSIWMDNYYNSPALSRVLKSLDFDCIGTLKPNRQFVPLEISELTKNSLAQNEVIMCTSGDVDVMAWRDKRVVCLTSTYHGNTVSWDKDKGKLLPALVADYNICMGGVDRKDQLSAMYPLERKRMRSWYKKFFRRLLNSSIINSYIIFNKSPSTTSRSRIEHRQFRLDLVKQILEKHAKQPTLPPPIKCPSSRIIPTPYLAHFPTQLPIAASGKERMRRKCAQCGDRTSGFCTPCYVPLCPFTCFAPFHKP